MQVVVGLLIFCLVLFIYLHVYYHLKVSNDLEVFELDQPSKDKLEEVCDIRQPVLFEYSRLDLERMCIRDELLSMYGAFDVQIREIKSLESSSEDDLHISLPLNKAVNVLDGDGDGRYIIESNDEFLDETGVYKIIRANDDFLRPYMVSSSKYDITMGSNNSCTTLQYNINYRNYYLVTEGEIKLKLAPPRSGKYLYEVQDYENMEFKSPINPWNIQSEYSDNFNKVKFLELTLTKGMLLHIPAYWWYSICYSKKSTICSLTYRTFMNTVAIFPKLVHGFLQKQNVKRQTAPTFHIEENNDKCIEEIEEKEEEQETLIS